MKVHLDGVAILCNFLVTAEYLTRDGSSYWLIGMTEKRLLDVARTNMSPWFTFREDEFFPFCEHSRIVVSNALWASLRPTVNQRGRR